MELQDLDKMIAVRDPLIELRRKCRS